ncbi:hypothetical protein [Xanthomonas graminis]|uniref:hypothetical protein n=1 Tax=Xanthomonas graminis TaxID=3390026 RepID=UPI0012DA4752|nr:hypothetical protein [Xanthomonas translucens]
MVPPLRREAAAAMANARSAACSNAKTLAAQGATDAAEHAPRVAFPTNPEQRKTRKI